MVSELEAQRLANIQRNNELLKQLELDSIQNDIADDVARKKAAQEAAKKAKKRRAAAARSVKKESPEPPMPTRKSRRLAGVKVEPSKDEVYAKIEADNLKVEQERARKEGEMKLGDIVKNGEWDAAMDVLGNFGGKVSLGDFFESTIIDNPDLAKAREELSSLVVCPKFDPVDVKIASERVIGMAIHPAVDKKLIVCGDKGGELGIWDADQVKVETDADGDDYNMPQIFTFKVHSRAIATIQISPFSPQKAFSGSYDGSVRVLDLKSMSSSESFIFDSDPKNPVGISDFHIPEENLLYFSTLEGHFGIHDMRESPTSVVKLFSMHDKKLGGFSFNPNDINQVVSASLDRTMKVWDLRISNKVEDQLVPGLYGEYNSRLSVSTADWSKSGHVVCNGYDDSINIFDFTKSKSWEVGDDAQNFVPTVKIKHNCQTGKWVSILKAHWHNSPADGIAKFTIANMKRYIDVFAANGQQLAHLSHDSMTAVPAVVRFHPTLNWLAGTTASAKVYLFEKET